MDNPFVSYIVSLLFASLWLISGYYFIKTEKLTKKELESCRTQVIAYIIVFIFTAMIILSTNSISYSFIFLGVTINIIAYLFKNSSVIIWPIIPRNVKNKNFNLQLNIVAGMISLVVGCYLLFGH